MSIILIPALPEFILFFRFQKEYDSGISLTRHVSLTTLIICLNFFAAVTTSAAKPQKSTKQTTKDSLSCRVTQRRWNTKSQGAHAWQTEGQRSETKLFLCITFNTSLEHFADSQHTDNLLFACSSFGVQRPNDLCGEY